MFRVPWWTESRRNRVVAALGRAVGPIRGTLREAQADPAFPARMVLLDGQTEEVDGDRTRQREGWPAGEDPRPLGRRTVRCANHPPAEGR